MVVWKIFIYLKCLKLHKTVFGPSTWIIQNFLMIHQNLSTLCKIDRKFGSSAGSIVPWGKQRERRGRGQIKYIDIDDDVNPPWNLSQWFYFKQMYNWIWRSYIRLLVCIKRIHACHFFHIFFMFCGPETVGSVK